MDESQTECAYEKCRRGPEGTRNHFESTKGKIYCCLGCNQAASRIRRQAANPPVVEEADDPIRRATRELERLRDENTALRRALTQARREEDSAEHLRETIFQIAGEDPAPPTWLYEPTYGGAPGVPVSMWSDWHWDEVVKADELGGLNEYNTTVQVRRLKALYTKIIDLAFQHMVNPQYPGIVINLGGDMITGEIHEELADTNERYVLQTLLDLSENIIAALKVIADAFGRVFVPCVVGNHGRMTMKPRMKGVVATSYEWLVYCMVKKFFENDDRLQFAIPSETDARYAVYDHRILLTHGDRMGVKGGDGIIGAIGPIMRGAMKIGRSEAQLGRDFDQLVIGHWHNYMTPPGILVNGTSKGYDEFARNALRASFQPPIQALWYVHEKYGVTSHWGVLLDEPQKNRVHNWVSWLDTSSQSSIIAV